jgi:glycosyltransferase involved in cell wall biosynthesis
MGSDPSNAAARRVTAPRQSIPASDVQVRRPRVHYHTDCPSFAGCETMLANLLASPAIRERFEVSFSYRASARYTEGLQQRVRIDFPVDALVYPEPSYALAPLHRLPGALARVGRVVSRFLTTVPLLLYETFLLRRLFLARGPEILHVNNGGYPAALSARAAAIAGRLAGVPHVLMTVNNLAEGYERPDRRLQYPLDRLVVRCVSLFTTGSQAAANRLRDVLGLPAARSRAVTNGGDLRTPTETIAQTRQRLGLGIDGRMVFGIVGFLEPRKGHEILLEAVRRLVHDRPEPPHMVLLILGDGPLRARLERFVVENRLTEYCRFLGHEANAMNVISAIDVLVLASIANEDFPNVILEAMGAGKAVISTRIAGTPEQVVDEVTGLLVAPADPEALAQAMARVIASPERTREMGVAGRDRFEKCFTAEVSARRYLSLYESLLDGAAASHS